MDKINIFDIKLSCERIALVLTFNNQITMQKCQHCFDFYGTRTNILLAIVLVIFAIDRLLIGPSNPPEPIIFLVILNIGIFSLAFVMCLALCIKSLWLCKHPTTHQAPPA